MLKHKDDEKASISLKRILGICLIFLFISGICVFAANKQVRNVKITLANGCQMNVVTSKTKVADILDEKHIILLPEEKVTPDENTTIGVDGEIVISEKSAQDEVSEMVSQNTETTNNAENNTDLNMDTISQAYSPITEKIEVKEEAIPFETVTKNVANGSSETQDKVLQEGKEGKKQVTYKVKYQNNTEIERKEISSVVLEEPVDKVVQVRAVTNRSSRSSSSSTKVSAPETTSASGISLGRYRITAYCGCALCCGKSTGRTASGTYARANHTIAAPGNFAFGTKLKINGIVYTVEDRGGAVKGKTIDVYFNSHSAALAFGTKYANVELIK